MFLVWFSFLAILLCYLLAVNLIDLPQVKCLLPVMIIGEQFSCAYLNPGAFLHIFCLCPVKSGE